MRPIDTAFATVRPPTAESGYLRYPVQVAILVHTGDTGQLCVHLLTLGPCRIQVRTQCSVVLGVVAVGEVAVPARRT